MIAPRVLGQNALNFHGVFDGHAGHLASDYCKNHIPTSNVHVVSRFVSMFASVGRVLACAPHTQPLTGYRQNTTHRVLWHTHAHATR
jgi:serine/threonine protein phosphatase PrpC